MDSYFINQLFREHLQKDETILWSGQPDPSVLFTRYDVFLVPFSLLWGGFAFFWEASVLSSWVRGADRGAPSIFFVLWGIPFVLLGIYFIFGRFVYKYWRKKNTYYALTNRRALILTRGLFGSFQSTYISNSQNIGLSMGARGTGSITFGNVPFWGAAYGNSGMGIFGRGFGSSATPFYDIKTRNRFTG